MEPQQNTGSFMSPAGASADPIMEALARRQTGASPTTAQSSISQTPTPQAVPNTNPAPAAAPQTGVSTTSAVGMPPQSQEAQIILRALNDRLKTISKIDEASAIPPELPTAAI